jgi:hypothetical protein
VLYKGLHANYIHYMFFPDDSRWGNGTGFFFDASRHVLGCAAFVEHLTRFYMPSGVSFCNTTHQSLRIMCSLKWDEHKYGNVSQGSGHGPVKANTD